MRKLILRYMCAFLGLQHFLTMIGLSQNVNHCQHCIIVHHYHHHCHLLFHPFPHHFCFCSSTITNAHRWNSLYPLLAMPSSLHQERRHHPSSPPPPPPSSRCRGPPPPSQLSQPPNHHQTGRTTLLEATFSAPFSLCPESSPFCRLVISCW